MSCKFFTQPKPAIGPLSPFSIQKQEFTHWFTIEERIHQHLKNFEGTLHLKYLSKTLKNRQEKLYTPFVYPEQILNLEKAIENVIFHVGRETLRLYEIELIYIHIGEVVQDMAYFTPRIDNHRDTRESLEDLLQKVMNVLKANQTLAMKFEMFDDSPAKLETKKLRGLLHKTNYFLEFKKYQINNVIDINKKAFSRI